MTTYIIKIMNLDNYNKMMGGSDCYHSETVKISAENADEAIFKAKIQYPDMIIDAHYVKSVEELEAKKVKMEAKLEAERKTEAERKAKRIEREKMKAEQAGMTVEEYRAEQNRQRKIRKTEKEITELIQELDKKKKYLEKLKKST